MISVGAVPSPRFIETLNIEVVIEDIFETLNQMSKYIYNFKHCRSI